MTTKSPRSPVITLLLCIFLGTFGIHRFYIGKAGTGILMLITAGGFGIWVIVDIVLIICGQLKDSDGKAIEFDKATTDTFKKILLVIVSIVGGVAVLLIFIALLAFYIARGLTDPIKQQLAALRADNVVAAYSQTSKEFQNRTSLESFESFLERYPTVKNNETASFTSRKYEDDEGKVKALVKAKDGSTTSIEYRLTKEDGDWKILGLQVQGETVSVVMQHKEMKRNEPIILPNVFDDPLNNFSINYANNWTFDQPAKEKIIFSGKKGTSSSASVVNIQTIASINAGGNFKDTKEVLEDLKKQIKSQTSKIEVLGEGPVTLKQHEKKFEGITFVFNYTYKNQEFKQMLVVVPSPDGKAFYVWTFNSTKNQFDIDLPVARAMLNSWVIH